MPRAIARPLGGFEHAGEDLINVVFPLPLWPISVTRSPAAIDRSSGAKRVVRRRIASRRR